MKQFVLDPRIAGGRKIIERRRLNHFKSLCFAKAEGKSRLSRRPRNSKSNPRQSERPCTPGRLRDSSIDNRTPKTFDLSTRLSETKAKKRTKSLDQHLVNIQHMKRRINGIGSIQERKKNVFDPFANPSLLFKYPEEVSPFRLDPKHKRKEHTIQEKIINEIYKARICSNQDLNQLYEKIKHRFINAEKKTIDKAFTLVKKHFESF